MLGNMMKRAGVKAAIATINEMLPEVIGAIAEKVIEWMERCTPDDVDTVAKEMVDPKRAAAWRRAIAAVKGPTAETAVVKGSASP